MSAAYIHQCSDIDGLDRLATAGEVIAYVGYDCTAPSLHIGHLISIMMLTWLQRTGGKPIALMGAAPPGSATRPARTRRGASFPSRRSKATRQAIKGVFASASRTFGGGATAALMLDNAEWLATAQLYRVPARCGATFLGQSHADAWIRQNFAWSGTRSCPSSNSTTCYCRPTISSN